MATMTTDNANKKEKPNFNFFDKLLSEFKQKTPEAEASVDEALDIIASLMNAATTVFNAEHKNNKLMEELTAPYVSVAKEIKDELLKAINTFATVLKEASKEYDKTHNQPPSTQETETPCNADALVNDTASANISAIH